MEQIELTEQQKRELFNARQRGIARAKRQEKEYIQQGKGTRDWTPEQQKQLMDQGAVKDIDWHHMRSVSSGETYEEKIAIAENKNNIQPLSSSSENNEHMAAHGGNTRNRTNGYYDPQTKQTKSFGNGEPKAPEARQLTHPVYAEEKAKNHAEKREEGFSQEKKYDREEKRQIERSR